MWSRVLGLVIGGLLLVASSEGHAEEAEPEEQVRRKPVVEEVTAAGADIEWRVPVVARLLSGYLDGHRTRDERGGAVALSLSTRPALHWGMATLRTPLSLKFREVFGANLRELRGRGGLRLRVEPVKWLWVEPRATVSAAWRPDWSDQYQPVPEVPPDAPTGLGSTDRYSFFNWQVGARARWQPARSHRVEVQYGYRAADYKNDPSYRSIDDVDPEPNHLVPADNIEHRGEITYQLRLRRVRATVGAEAFLRDSEFIYARDAGTGATHAAPGGAPPNPLQSARGLEPRAAAEVLFFKRRLRIEAGFGWEMVDDVFQGYYSYAGPHPHLGVHARLPLGFRVGGSVEAWWRRYGPDSYAATAGWQPGDAGHPPLEFGDRRVDQRVRAELEASKELVGGLALVLVGTTWWRRTNFPNYEPGVFPRTRNYAIEWSYTTWRALVGVEWELDFEG